ncbi:putative F-box domain-containing protein [Helianthus anomalus]
MGANSSLLSQNSSDGSTHQTKLKLGDIPESCVALVLLYLDPPDISKLARLNRAFRAASSADFIWDAKLPPNYHHLIDEHLTNTSTKLGKYEIYARLTLPVTAPEFVNRDDQLPSDPKTRGKIKHTCDKKMEK